jgi:hypothetical protein
MFAMGTLEVKLCARCREEKPVEEFAWHRRERGQRQPYCRACQKVYGREHYLANREKYIRAEARRKRARNARRMQHLIDYLGSHPCVDCGESDPLVLEFDHIGEKSFTIGTGFAGRNWQAILDEIAKCEVVCANCHRRRTARRRGSVRSLLVGDWLGGSNL